MLTLFWRVNGRHLVREWGKLLLSLVGVALGVAVVLAIRASNESAFQAFSNTLDAVTGKATVSITSADGGAFSETAYARVHRAPGLRATTPILQSVAQAGSDGEPLTVLGIDVFTDGAFRTYTTTDGAAADQGGYGLEFLTQPDALLLAAPFAERHGVVRGDSITLLTGGRRSRFLVADVLALDGPARAQGGAFAVMDIAQAQQAFDRIGQIDRIDAIADPRFPRDEVLRVLRERLPDELSVDRPSGRAEQVERMLAAFRLNLTALASIALLVSMFLIYNTISTSAVRRRRELGILRALGATERQVFGLFLVEALVIGLVGSLIGLGLGVVLARLALDRVAQTISVLYVLVTAEHLALSPLLLVESVLIGVGSALAAAVVPAWEAARTPPKETFSSGTLDRRFDQRISKLTRIGLALLVAAGGATLLPAVGGAPIFGYLAALLIALGLALVTPAVLVGLRKAAEPLLRRLFGPTGSLAAGYLTRHLSRTSVAVAALMVAIAMLVGVAIMIGSFRETVDEWVTETVTGDVFIASTTTMTTGTVTSVPNAVVNALHDQPEIAAIERFTRRETTIGGAPALIAASDLSVVRERSRLLFRSGDGREILARAIQRGEVVVSESFSTRRRVGVGDSVTLRTPTGRHRLRIAGIYPDYAADEGIVLMDRPRYIALYRDTTVTQLVGYLRPGASLGDVVGRLRRTLAGTYAVNVMSNGDLRREIFRIFDQTFAITYALQAIALLVAAMGIVSTLMALIAEREREIGILKAVGASRRQIEGMTLIEAGLMGLAAVGLGLLAGTALSAVLIYVINRQSFGWTIQFRPPLAAFGWTVVLVLATALVSGLLPARYATRRPIREAVAYE